MTNVVRLYTPTEVDRLWDEYAELARALRVRPDLADDRQHNEAMIRAHSRFAKAFSALEGGL
ncbi:hypothetical protein [Sphingobium sp.]|uniref:hypothetical protein n=1 Tax=Sphingobium sp. TaxID=1912891 RepID=UPI0035C6F281